MMRSWTVGLVVVVVMVVSSCESTEADFGVGAEAEPSGRIVFSGVDHESLDIYVFDFATSESVRLTDSIGDESAPVLSPDGSRIVFQGPPSEDLDDPSNTDIYVMDSDGTDLTRLTTDPTPEASPAWSPDGERITFDRKFSDDEQAIFVINADGTGKERLTGAGVHFEPSWSPDGARIVFVSRREPPPTSDTERCSSDIYVMAADGTGQVRLTTRDGSHSQPRWAPDGTRIAFGHIEAGEDGRHIYTMNPDGTGHKRITPDGTVGSNPSWSPEQGFVVFESHIQMYLIRPDGSELQLLEHGMTQGSEPHWSQ